MKIIGIVLLTVAPLIYGLRSAKTVRDEVRFFGCAAEFARHLQKCVEYENRDTNGIIDSFSCSDETFGKLLENLRSNGYYREFPETIPISAEYKKALGEFFSTIGKVSRKELCDSARYYSDLFGSEYEKIKKAAPDKYKSRIVIGLAVGAMLAILFI